MYSSSSVQSFPICKPAINRVRGFQKNCSVHFRAVLVFLVWEESWMGRVDLKVVGEVSGTR